MIQHLTNDVDVAFGIASNLCTGRVLYADPQPNRSWPISARPKANFIDYAVTHPAILGADSFSANPGSNICGAVEHLPFPTHYFNAAICLNLLQWTPNPQYAITELLRVTKPNGQLAIRFLSGGPESTSADERQSPTPRRDSIDNVHSYLPPWAEMVHLYRFNSSGSPRYSFPLPQFTAPWVDELKRRFAKITARAPFFNNSPRSLIAVIRKCNIR